MGMETLDYGQPRRARAKLPLNVLALVAVLGIGGTTFVVAQASKHDATMAEARNNAADWTIAGEPCPAGAADQPPARYQDAFNSLTVGRRFGHAECRFVVTSSGKAEVCQFSGPAHLEVATAKGVYRFAPGVGVPATVSVIKGEAKCVLATTSALTRPPPHPTTTSTTLGSHVIPGI